MTDQTEQSEAVTADVYEPVSIEPVSTVATSQSNSISKESPKHKTQTQLDQQLFNTARTGTSDQVKALLNQGANVNYIDLKDGLTPLHQPCSGGRGPIARDVIKVLIDQGAELERRNFLGATPLLLACMTSDIFAITPLIEAGANVNVAYNDGSTPLHIAGQNGMPMIIDILLKNGADIETKNNAGRTALHEVALSEAESAAYAAGVLLQLGAFVDVTDHWGNTPLHLSLLGHRIGIAETILKHGGRRIINEKNMDGATALHEASRVGFKKGVELLIENGADMTLTDNDGELPSCLRRETGVAGTRPMIDRLGRADSQVEQDEPISMPVYGRSSSGQRARRIERYTRLSREDETEQDSEEEDDEDEKSVANAHIDTEDSIEVQIPDIPNNVWTGVRCENGDGFILAKYDNHDISFDAKLESITPCIHEGKHMHEIRFLINFMRPYSMDYRIRYAKIDVHLTPKEPTKMPNIRGIMPQADRVEVSDMEISSGQKLTVGAAGSGGPSNVNISMEGSKSKTSSFKGVRIIHGAIKDRTHACWRLYEEPGSKSGLPEIVRLLMLVNCETEFDIHTEFSVKSRHSLSFGLPRTLTAKRGLSYNVPSLETILTQEQESRLKQILEIADRAATAVEEANAFEKKLSRAIRQHARKDLIMQCGMKESYLQEWTDILNESKSFDFRSLREKLLEMDPPPPRVRVRDRRYLIRRPLRQSHPQTTGSDGSAISVTSPSPRGYSRRESDSDGDGRRRVRRSHSYESDGRYGRYERIYPPSERVGRRGDRGYGEGSTCNRNPMQNFSAVGPGYHVSRMA